MTPMRSPLGGRPIDGRENSKCAILVRDTLGNQNRRNSLKMLARLQFGSLHFSAFADPHFRRSLIGRLNPPSEESCLS